MTLRPCPNVLQIAFSPCLYPAHGFPMHGRSGALEGDDVKAILVVDDSQTMRRMVMASLKPLANVRFQEAANGLEALERLSLHGADLIILDLNMPDMHGVDLLRFLRRSPSLAELPVLVLTTRDDDESREEVSRLGVVRYLTKPFEPSELLRAVESVFKGA